MANKKVLYAEDKENLRNDMLDLMGKLGLDVDLAEDGGIALARFKANSDLSLLISDWDMPNMGGEELIKSVRAMRPDFPVIIYTGSSGQPESYYLSKTPNFNPETTRYVEKSIDAFIIMRTVAELLGLPTRPYWYD